MIFNKDAKNTWKLINGILNKHGKKNTISKIKIDNRTIDESQEIVDSFNNYFVEIGPKLASNIPKCDKNFFDYLPNSNPNSMYFVPVHEGEIQDIVNNFKSKKSYGHDDFNNYIIKKIIENIVVPFTYICNLSISSGVIPKNMKLAKIIPILKKRVILNYCQTRGQFLC